MAATDDFTKSQIGRFFILKMGCSEMHTHRPVSCRTHSADHVSHTHLMKRSRQKADIFFLSSFEHYCLSFRFVRMNYCRHQTNEMMLIPIFFSSSSFFSLKFVVRNRKITKSWLGTSLYTYRQYMLRDINYFFFDFVCSPVFRFRDGKFNSKINTHPKKR